MSSNTTLINSHPNEASFKNNNPTGLTWWVSKELRNAWTAAGIQFGEWGNRPANEWWKYIKFASLQDWMRAYEIALFRSNLSLKDRLKQWVWTNKADDYAFTVMNNAWLSSMADAPITSLDEDQRQSLMRAQLKQESGGLYNYMNSQGWITQKGISMPGTEDSWYSKTYSSDAQSWAKAISEWRAKLSNITWKDAWALKTEVMSLLNDMADNNSSASAWNTNNSSYSPAAQTWIQAIQEWRMTKEEVFSTLWNSKEMAALKAEIQKGLLEKNDKNQAMYDATAGNEERMIESLDWLLDDKNAGTRESATWPRQWSFTNWYEWDRDDYLAKMKFLLNTETLNALADAKNRWISFGALSWAELSMVQQAASELNGLARREWNNPEWRIIWFNWSEKRFKELLEQIRDNYKKAYKKKTGRDYVAPVANSAQYQWQWRIERNMNWYSATDTQTPQPPRKVGRMN